jgi:hypothetical protein
MNLRLFRLIESPMAPPTPRQQKAEALAQEIMRLGGYVLSPLPLRDDDKELRIQILDDDSHILQAIKDWGWTPTLGGPHPRISFTRLEPATIYRIEIPVERQPIVDTTIRGEISSKKKPDTESV